MKVLYTAEALATGEGRNGHVRSTDGRVDLDVAVPKEMGGSGDGSNPEQLFAAGYAACFHSALLGVARQRKITVADSAIGASVSIGPLEGGGYTLAVHLEASLPGVERDVAQELVEQAHQVCPYSNATRGNIEVTVAVVDE
ncbi:organic hydroperoxide resistance protein [Oerskovia sp. NPDC057915]|uniref:organic hydroperoxide resistance protein n=1 Tax=Oerskovia sp. NPDC057915 TaxID=3346280 RepID=UPI0036DA5A9A